jgi:hypothetical protein
MRAIPKTLLALLLLGLAAPATAATTLKPAPAPATGVSADVRCLLTMYALGQDKQRQQAAVIGAYFFIGRINARAPGIDLPAAVKAEAAKLQGKSLNEEAKRCGPMVEGGMRALQASFGGPRGAPPSAPNPGAPSLGAPAAQPSASGLPPAIPQAAPK